MSPEQLRQLSSHLLEEGLRLCDVNAALSEELVEARKRSIAAREARKAALNLMQDAMAAREAEQRELVERRRAEKELRASEEKYRTLFESIDEGFCIIEKVPAGPDEPPDFRFVEANPACAVHLGRQDVVGTTMRQALPGEPEEWYRNFEQVLATGEPFRDEHALASQSRVIELYAFCLKGHDDGKVALVFRDVSERKAAEEALHEADRLKDEFLATLAHELRNPLAPIANSLQILRICGDDPMIIESCEVMERQVNHMVRLVDDLLEVSRITRGSIELRKTPTDLATVLRGALDLSQPLIDLLGHWLSISLPEEPVPLWGDVVRLGQVFSNVLNNAAKYTDRRGRIWLDARREGDEVVVSVRDTGIGISPEDLPKIFDMFAQADRASDHARGGLGIGLTLARRLAEMHGGTITAHSEGLGKGSEFTVRLPVAAARQDQPESLNGSATSGVIARRVLVVDDNEDAALSLAKLLKALGTNVETAHDGPTALQIVERSHPEVVFLDIGMPGMDGMEVARRIRQQPECGYVTLVAVTGWGQAGDRRRTREAGFDYHLVKPADVRDLRSLLA
jgi:PAS domain S-box-containing protein